MDKTLADKVDEKIADLVADLASSKDRGRASAGRLMATGITVSCMRWMEDEAARGTSSTDVTANLVQMAGSIAALALVYAKPGASAKLAEGVAKMIEALLIRAAVGQEEIKRLSPEEMTAKLAEVLGQ